MNTEPATPDFTDVGPGVTDAEASVIAEAAAADRAAAEQLAADRAAAEQAAVDAEAARAAADPIAQARAAAEAAQAAAEAAQREVAELRAQQAAAQQQQQATPPRNFDAELSAIEELFDDGKLTLAEYRAKERELIREQERHNVTVETQQRAAQDAEAQAAQAWDTAYAAFTRDPGNAALLLDPVKRAGFEAAMDLIYKEAGGNIAYDALLLQSRERVTGIPAVDATAAAREAARQRALGQPDPVTTLRDVPNAGSIGGAAPGAALDNLDISDLEDRLMRMPTDQVDAFLAAAPGGLRDNPRAA